MNRHHSEAKSAKKKSDVVSFVVSFRVGEISVSLSEFFTDIFAGCFSTLCSLYCIFFKIFKIEITNNKSSWDDVILINMLQESLDTSSFGKSLLAYSSLDVSRVASDTHQQQMGEFIFLN